MQIILTILLVFLNIIACIILYNLLGKKIDIKNKVIFIIAGILSIFILTSLIYFISGIGVEKSVTNASYVMIVFAFLPINVMAIMAPLEKRYIKYIEGDISYKEFRKKLVLIIAITVLITIIEIIYFKNIQINISNMKG